MTVHARFIVLTLLPAIGWLPAIGCSVALGQNAAPAGRESLNPLHSIAKESLKAFLDAPLFDPTRRRAADVAPVVNVVPASTEEPPPPLHLLGVIHGDRDMAMVRRNDEAKPLMLATGDHIGSWLVTILATTGIRLSEGKRAYDYAIFLKGVGNAGPTRVEAPDESVGAVTPGPLGHPP